MKKKMYYFLIFIVLFLVASFISIYSYGVFAKQVRGAPSYTLPVQSVQSFLDRAIAPHWQAHPQESGLILLKSNLDAFAVRAVTAREAGRSLDLQYYVWHDDLTGQLLGLELLQAADRGVRVRLLLDDMTVHDRGSMLSALNEHPYIEIRVFNPTRARDTGLRRGIEMLLRAFSVNRRMHNKAWIADGRVAIVGGRNIGNEYFDASPEINFFDVDLMVTGSAVEQASHIFDDYWNSPAAFPLETLVTPPENALGNLRQKAMQSTQSILAHPYIQHLHQTPSIQELFSGKHPVYWAPDVHVYADPAEKIFGQGQPNWLIHTLQPIWNSTTQDFKVISPYFVPTKSGMHNFTTLQQDGVSISILTNSLAATDVLMVHGGYAPYRKPLLELGVKLYELKPFGSPDKSLLGSSGASLHTKAFLIDGETGFVGSFNFDPRSALWNTEMGIIFKEPTIVAQLMQEFNKRTSSTYSYELILQNNELAWKDVSSANEEEIWTHDPQSKWWQRTATKVISWLPIESQL